MFKIQWDKKNNSILFKEKLKPDSQLIPPRPVYFEEMDLLGFDKLYDYPKSEEPLLWSIGRAYYYKGEKIAEANGGGLYEKPTMNFIYTGSILPVDISKLVSANEEYLTILTNEAKTYINEIYKTYRKSHSFSVAFSGGKDSQVVLDLVSQVIPPEDYFAIFTDTEMELPETYETVSKSFKSYKQLFSNFRNIIANQFRPILDNWCDFGPPSRLQRWCCTVCKSLPHKNALDNLNLPQTDLITIEGVRKAESNRRSNYERLAIGIKHSNITNVRPIFDWNDSEVYVYLMYRSISINVAYRYGLSRVGCVVCPFSSDWSEFILSAIHPEVIEKFYSLIRNSIKRIGVESDRDQIDYLRQGKWKMRAGSGALPTSDVFFSSSIESNVLQINVINPQSSILEWIKILNPFELIESIDEKTYKIKFEDKIKEFTIYIFDNGFTIHHHISKVNDMLISYLKRISYKAAYCSNCGVCYVTCPNRAISMNNVLLINRSKCSSCFKCLQVCDKGCFIAKSRTQFKGVNKMSDKKISLDKYAGFGLREEWLLNFFQNPNYWKEGLGSKQIPAFKNWLIEAELISHVKETSRLYDLLKDVELSLL